MIQPYSNKIYKTISTQMSKYRNAHQYPHSNLQQFARSPEMSPKMTTPFRINDPDTVKKHYPINTQSPFEHPMHNVQSPRTVTQIKYESITKLLRQIQSHEYVNSYIQSSQLKIYEIIPIIRTCYEHYMLKQILQSTEKSPKIKHEDYLLPEKGVSLLNHVIVLKENFQKQNSILKNLALILNDIDQGTFFESKYSFEGEDMLKLKNSLLEINNQLKLRKSNQVYIRNMMSQFDYVLSAIGKLIGVQKIAQWNSKTYADQLVEFVQKLKVEKDLETIFGDDRFTEANDAILQTELETLKKELQIQKDKQNSARIKMAQILLQFGPLEKGLNLSFDGLTLNEIVEMVSEKVLNRAMIDKRNDKLLKQRMQTQIKNTQMIEKFNSRLRDKSIEIANMKAREFEGKKQLDKIIQQKEKNLKLCEKQRNELKERLIDQNEQANNKINDLTQQLEHLSVKFENLEKQLNQVLLIKQEQEVQISSLSQNLGEQSNETLLEENKRLKAQLQKVTLMYEVIRSQGQEIEFSYNQKLLNEQTSLGETIQNLKSISEYQCQQIEVLESQNINLQQEKSKYIDNINQLEEQIFELKEQAQIQEQNLKKLQEDISIQRDEWKELYDKLQNATQEKNEMGEQNKNMEEDLEKIIQDKEAIQRQLLELKSQYEKLESSHQKCQEQLVHLDERVPNQLLRSKSAGALAKVIQEKELQIRQLLEDKDQILKNNYTLNEIIQEYRDEIDNLHKEKETAERQFQQLTNKCSQKEEMLEEAADLLEEKENQISSLKNKLNGLPVIQQDTLERQESIGDIQISNLNGQLQAFKQSSLLYLAEKTELAQALQRQKQLYSQKTSQLQQTQEKLISMTKQLQQKQGLIKELDKEKVSLRKQVLSSNVKIDYCYYFQGELLYSEYDHKKYLVDLINNTYQKTIHATKLLYRFDILNKVNIHKYIDGHSNVLLLLKSTAGQLIAAFSESPFLPKVPSTKDGLIISLTNRATFNLVERNKKAIIYDDYYIIFGNSQIRVKGNEAMIFSNFGINNGYYNAAGHKVNTILGKGNQREVTMAEMQIYQLIFI